MNCIHVKCKGTPVSRILGLFFVAISLFGCEALKIITEPVVGPVVDTADKVTRHLDDAIAKLGQESSNWQTTLKELEDKLRSDGESLIANEVTQLAQKGIATGGTELRCDVDFVRIRMGQDLQRLVAKLTKKPVPPLEPALCQVVPTYVDMANLSHQLEFYGYDLNAADKGPINVILKHDGGEESLNQWVAQPTHYLKTLNLAIPNLCGKQNRKIVLRYGPDEISTINVIRKICPGPSARPPREPERILLDQTYDAGGGGLSGYSKQAEFGGPCSPGFERLQTQVIKLEGAGACYAEGIAPRTDGKVHLGWVDPNNVQDCKTRVHFAAGVFEGVKCRIVIREIGMEKSVPPTPDCGCW